MLYSNLYAVFCVFIFFVLYIGLIKYTVQNMNIDCTKLKGFTKMSVYMYPKQRYILHVYFIKTVFKKVIKINR